MKAKQGLEGIVFSDTRLSEIDGQAGKLSYCGYDIRDLAAKASYEEVAFLLLYQRLPAKSELQLLVRWLRSNRTLHRVVWGIMHSLPERATPMEALATIVATLPMFDDCCAHAESGGPHLCQATSLTAKLPTIIASFDRLRRNRVPIEPHRDLGHTANFLYMLTGRVPDPMSARALEILFVLLAEHGMNASTFSARVTASTLGDVYSAVVTALGTLKGPLHGGAAPKAMEQLMEIGCMENVDLWFERQVAMGRRLMGFGHRVYKVEDPRATILRKLARQVAERNGETKWYDIAARLEERVLAHPYFQERRILTNVDFYSAPLLYALGLPVDLFTPVFAVARVIGWTAHILEQQQHNRLIRPRAKYVGPANLCWIDAPHRQPLVEADQDTPCLPQQLAASPAASSVPIVELAAVR